MATSLQTSLGSLPCQLGARSSTSSAMDPECLTRGLATPANFPVYKKHAFEFVLNRTFALFCG